jgi:ubiquitin-like 1-activating enzyme E1 B
VLRFNPQVQVHAFHADIKDEQFHLQWFKRFDVVMNALDNLDARRHVNKMCIAADVPLIESGTAGYLGQVSVIKRGETECYDCVEKPTPKTFPICTIRTTPTAPVHCIVWAKDHLFTQLFGRADDSGAIQADAMDDAQHVDEWRREQETLLMIRSAFGTPHLARDVFSKVFNSDIARLRSFGDLWKTRAPPTPLDYDQLHAMTGGIPESTDDTARNHTVWALKQTFELFQQSLNTLAQRHVMAQDSLYFEKDDEDMLDFVTATANLRANIFGIDMQTRFNIKSIAGSIIPAIATTNAIIAGSIVLQAMQALAGNIQACKTVHLCYVILEA